MNDQQGTQTREEEDGHPTNVVPFRRPHAIGGGTPPNGGSGSSGKNWLDRLEVGTRFLSKLLGQPGSELDEFIVGANMGEGIVLLAKNIQTMGKMEWHDSLSFSKINKLMLILEVVHDDNQHLQSGRMAGDEEPQKPDQLHEEQ